MGCVASMLHGNHVGPSPHGVMIPTSSQQAAQMGLVSGLHSTKSKRRSLMGPVVVKEPLTMQDQEPAERLHALIMDMGPKGKIELTSVVAHEASGQENGTLVQRHIPSLKQIPGMVLTMVQITELNLRCNQIHIVPKEIDVLTKLEVLIIAENQLFEIPKEITKLKHLRLLDLSENHLTKLPESIGALDQLEIMRLQRNKLTALPNGLKGCKRLKILNVYSNMITTVGDGIAELSGLQVNRLVSLPSLEALTKLELLQAHQNALQQFPLMGVQMTQLKKIDVNNNQIYDIPVFFEKLSALQHLNLRRNRVTSMPAFLCRCKQLEILDFGFNPLEPPIPADLVTLPNLRTFLIDGTKITTLPLELIGLKQVSRVNFGSCLRMTDQETCEVVMELRNTCAQNGGWLKTG